MAYRNSDRKKERNTVAQDDKNGPCGPSNDGVLVQVVRISEHTNEEDF